MDRPKILIADSGEELCQSLYAALSSHYCITLCDNGQRALELIRSQRPDILVLDLMLPGLDGLTMLHRMQSDGFRPAVIATSFFYSPYTAGALQQLQVDYMMQKPCDPAAIVERVEDLAAQLQPAAVPQVDLTTKVSAMLLSMGFTPRKDGFRFLQSAIPRYFDDPAQSMTKELYMDVGAEYGKSGEQVERSIRSAIEHAFADGDPQVWEQYFPVPCGIAFRPANGDFISRMATELSQLGYRRYA